MVCIGFGIFILHGVWTLECYVYLCDSAYGASLCNTCIGIEYMYVWAEGLNPPLSLPIRVLNFIDPFLRSSGM